MPDLILINADIRTMDMSRPRARAMAVAGGRIAALGDDATIRALADRRTRVVDAGGRLVLPGFQDAHVNLQSGGLDLATAAQLYDVTDIKGLQEQVAGHAASAGNLPIVLGSGWQPGLFGDHNLTSRVIDAVVSDRPAILFDSSYHNACLNSRAVALTGLDRATPDPVNGHFVRDAAGEPTGMLHEDAIAWALARLPALTDAQQVMGVRAGQAHANAHGITGIIDPRIEDREAAAYAAVAAEGALTLRVSGAALVKESDTPRQAVERLSDLRRRHSGPDFWVQSAKFFFDGVFENRTAALIAPYADPRGGNCVPMFRPDQVTALFTALDAARFQIHVHVIGDLAARLALDGFEAAMAANGRWPSRHQLAHLQLVDPADFARIGQLGAMANIQPLWARYDPVVPDIALDMVGADRLTQVYAFRRMIDLGASWCLSSDWPVSTLNPFEIIETAVTRQARLADGAGPPFLPDQALTVEEAVLGYTAHAADACWRGDISGRLVPGLSADFIVVDRDVFACALPEISATRVLLTVFKGRDVYRAPGFEG
jgi:predicted amidohydrolase YtcJ